MTTTTTPEERAAAVDLLRRVEERVRNGWTRGAIARNQHGAPCDAESPHAVRFCVLGALRAETFPKPCRTASEALSAVLGYASLTSWNDRRGRKKSEVLAAVRAARERLEGASD